MGDQATTRTTRAHPDADVPAGLRETQLGRALACSEFLLAGATEQSALSEVRAGPA